MTRNYTARKCKDVVVMVVVYLEDVWSAEEKSAAI